jgi:PAS domain S-box-containing protein
MDAAFDAVPAWLALIDPDYVVRRVNRTMAEALGVDQAAVIGRKCHELIHGADHPAANCPHLRLMRDPAGPTHDTVEVPGKGRFAVSCGPLRDADGEVVGSVHLMHDISRLAHVETEAFETADYLQQVLDAVPTPIYHKDAEGRYVAVNRAFAEAAGLERDAIIGRTAQAIFPAGLAADSRDDDLALFEGGGQETRVTRGFRAGLGRRLVEVHRSVYTDAAGRATGIVGVEFDVTERERTENALRRTEADLLRAQELGHMGSWEWDVRTGTFTWSEELYRIWGIDADQELTAKSIVALVHPDDRDATRGVHERLRSGVDAADHDFRIVRPDGAIVHLHQTLQAERAEDGTLLRAFGIMQDMTDTVRTRDSLRSREALLRGLFETMPSGCIVCEVQGDGRSAADYLVTACNQASLRMEGRRGEEVIGKSLRDLRPQASESGLTDLLWRVWRTGDPEQFAARSYADERLTSWLDTSVSKLPTGELVVVYRDVTAEKRTEEALRASEAEMHAVFDLAGIPMAVLDTRGRLRRWNRAFQQALGYPADDLQRMTIRDITPPEDRAATLRRMGAAMDGAGSPYRVDRRFVTVDGRDLWFHVWVTPVLGPKGDVVALIAVGTEITGGRKE